MIDELAFCTGILVMMLMCEYNTQRQFKKMQDRFEKNRKRKN